MNILFLHRLDLVHLFAPVSIELSTEHKIIHVAFSDIEQEILIEKYGIHENIINLSNIRDNFYDNQDDYKINLKELDDFIYRNSEGRFNLNSSIYLDRTYKNLTLDECLRISLAYYKSWKRIFNEFHPQLFFHEPPAIFFTHLASIFCKSLGVHYLTQIHVIGTRKQQWIFLEGDNASPIEIILNKNRILDSKSINIIDNFLHDFYQNTEVLMAYVAVRKELIKKNNSIFFIKRFLGLLFRHLKLNFKKVEKVSPKQHIQKFLINNQKSFFVELENIYGRIFHDFYFKPTIQEPYFFYPLHLEPEAVVLYYAEGWYEGQIKLIENIAIQLPIGTFLYVKDHPHGGAYRDVQDYKRLLKMKNVRLIHPDVSGKSLIKNSIGVITINGTAGFEALLMNKYVFCFGRAFYSSFKGVKYIKHIKDLRSNIYDLHFKEANVFDYKDILAFLESSHEGFVSYFAGRQDILRINIYDNAKIVAEGIKKLISKLENNF